MRRKRRLIMDEMKGTHRVTFENLVDRQTGDTASIRVPDTLVYEAGLFEAGLEGKQAALRHLREIRRKKKK